MLPSLGALSTIYSPYARASCLQGAPILTPAHGLKIKFQSPGDFSFKGPQTDNVMAVSHPYNGRTRKKWKLIHYDRVSIGVIVGNKGI